MPRRARSVFPGIAHHVTQRGNNRQRVFFSDSDYERYLRLLTTHCGRCGVAITAYCLMPNHVHLIAVPEHQDSLSKAMGRTHSEYALAFNLSEGRSGHLWQNRFFSCPLDRDHLARTLLYVELNPVRAGLVDEASRWAWSSASPRPWRGRFDSLSGLGGRREFPHRAPPEGTERLASGLSGEDLDRIRRSTRVGEPLGSTKFILDLERRAGRGLKVRERGRPRKPVCDVEGAQVVMFSE